MTTEIEAKWTAIDPQRLRVKLRSVGAVLVHPERLMRRKVFDFPNQRFRKMGGWVRVRDEGDKVTMSYKQLDDRSLHGTKEITLVVDSFDQAVDLITALGLEQKSYQETKRETWQLNGAEVTVDTWPWIPPFVEIEADKEETLRAVAAVLDLPWERAKHGSVETAYQEHYDVTEDDIDSWEIITFVPVPVWLEAKRRQR